MSNSHDDLAQYDRNYNSAMRKLREKNAELEKAKEAWENDQSEGKPPLEYVIGNGPLSQKEMEARADERAKEQMRQAEAMEKSGLAEKPKKRSLEAMFGGDEKAIAEARKLLKRERDKANKKSRDRDRDDNERDLDM